MQGQISRGTETGIGTRKATDKKANERKLLRLELRNMMFMGPNQKGEGSSIPHNLKGGASVQRLRAPSECRLADPWWQRSVIRDLTNGRNDKIYGVAAMRRLFGNEYIVWNAIAVPQNALRWRNGCDRCPDFWAFAHLLQRCGNAVRAWIHT